VKTSRSWSVARPAPGINAVIAAAAIEARNQGLRALGLLDGYKWLMRGDLSHVQELDIGDVSLIHFEGGSILRTSRANPTQSVESLRQVAESLRRLEVSYLVTIGGNDTAFARTDRGGARRALVVAHVPKTIDNALPWTTSPFGFTRSTLQGPGPNLMRIATTEAVLRHRHGRPRANDLGIGGAAARLDADRRGVQGERVPLAQVADISRARS
jgi:6-phosphofructokinase 1